MDLKVGLELHVYLDVTEKLFCNCPVDYDAAPNTAVCPVCTGQPGSKPMLPNKEAVDKAIQIALVLGCEVSEQLLFQRKHYSWPDLPNGYQKTMSGDFSMPVGLKGNFRGIGIQQCHLEEDPARWDPVTGRVDYNRSGYPLMEIVTDPDFTNLEELRSWLDELVLALSYLKAMHRGAGVKGDVNVSIGPKFERVEIKNINSFTAMVEAAAFEIGRQSSEVSAGNAIPPQTRAWDDAHKETLFMRSKETASDYRFIPEPDLPTIFLSSADTDVLRAGLPSMPWEKRTELEKLGLSSDDAATLANDFDLISLYESVSDIDPAFSAKWVRREVVRIAHYHHKDVGAVGFTSKHLRDVLSFIKDGTITETVGQKIMEAIGDDPSVDVRAYIEAEGLASVGGADELKTFAEQVIAEQPQAVADYRGGSEKSLHFLVGQVMRKTKGAAKPDVVLSVFKELLG